MTIKRKRSTDDSPLSLSLSSFGTPTSSCHTFDGAMDTDAISRPHGWDFASASRVKGSDWGNRTHKRFRDNRPDERAIHENTLQKLFAAQRHHPNVAPIPSSTSSAQQQQLPHPLSTSSKPQKSTLHSFWKQLPAPPVQPPCSPQLISSLHPRCEDCDAPLHPENEGMDIDIDMEMEMSGGAVESSPFACRDCGKSVCAGCAVVADQRHCLGCATTRREGSNRWW